MHLRNLATERIILPFSDIVIGNSVSKHLKFLMHSQDWSMERMVDFQNMKLEQLIEHSYANVPYYTRVFNELGLKPVDIKTKEDLQKLPVLTKDTVRKNINNGSLFAKNMNPKKFLSNNSSGSTGEPLQYYESKDSNSFWIAANIRGWYNMGYKLGDSYVKLSVNPRNTIVKKLQDFSNNCLYFSSRGVTNSDILRFYKLLIKEKPKYLRGYPSTLSVIADYFIKNSLKVPKICAINTTGEILFPDVRGNLERVFDCKVFDSYRGEAGALLFQNREGIYSISHEYAITEILNDKNEVIDSGKGEILSTDLWNYATPFIRYAVKDMVDVDSSPGHEEQMFRVSRIYGRLVDMLRVSSGKVLIVHFFTGYFAGVKSVDQFQIIQRSINKIELNLVVNSSFNDIEKNRIFLDVKQYIGNEENLELKIVDNIPFQKNGKRRFMLKEFQ